MGGGIGDGVEITKDKNIMGGIGKNGVCGGGMVMGGNILLSLLMMIMNHSSICYGIILIILLCFIL